MATLANGARAVVRGSRGNTYTLERKDTVYSCTCPAWRNQSLPIGSRTCKHLRAHLGDAEETARIGAAVTAPRELQRIRAPRVTRFIEDRERREARHAALERSIERFPVLDDRMQTVYGLRLPKHLARAMGFWNGLSKAERKEAWAYMGNGPAGVGEWFLDGMLERRVIAGLDERLEYRYRRDPPEMVTIFTGNSDGGHWGLWYDDPKELPAAIVQNYARDSAETGECKRTLLESLREDVAGREDESSFDPAEWPHRTAILEWLDVVLERELDVYSDERTRWMGARPNVLGGMGSIDPAWTVPPDLEGYAKQQERSERYQQRDPVVKEWIALARKELDAGSAGRALFIGRELHWVDADEWRSDCTELLVRAYERLDRHALARIVKVHHEHRDLASVSVYEPIEASAFSIAASSGDAKALEEEIAKYPPSESDLASALRSRHLDVLDVVLALPAADAAVEEAATNLLEDARGELDLIEHATPDNQPLFRESAARSRAAAVRIFERRGARGTAFAAALASDPELRLIALAHADLAWRSRYGRSVLHIAAGIPSLDAVQRLLDRGADPRVRDKDGKTAYDITKSAWEHNMREANAVFELLDARGGGPPKQIVEATVEWEPGATVKHKQFGDGVIESVTGIGDQTKLTIKFATATKTLIAKFVTRA